MSDTLEGSHSHFRGGEQRGQAISREDILNELCEALLAERYTVPQASATPKEPDRVYDTNKAFWTDALAAAHFPGANLVLENFHVTEWLPFAPGRYFAEWAESSRQLASMHFAMDREEYTPEGKASMVRGGIGAIRLAEKRVGRELYYFLGASSNGIAHQGIPVALSMFEYRRLIQPIKEHGGCRARLVGTLRTMTEELPTFYYGPSIPRYCFFAEEVKPGKPSGPKELLTTTAIMFALDKEQHERWSNDPNDDPNLTDKSWSFCSFDPGASRRAVQTAASWLYDYAKRYSHTDPRILTDFDEHYSLFTCPVEFPLRDIVRGQVDWETLRSYSKIRPGTYIETYIKEQTIVKGDKIEIHGSGNTIVNRSTVQNAFNRVKAKHDEETARALLEIETAINKSGNKDAAENFESFSKELSESTPKKSLLKTLWKGTLAALPTLVELPDAIAKISALFT